MKDKLFSYASNARVLLGLYLLISVIASVHLILLGNKTFNGLDIYKHYNNFVIFRQSFFHLINGQDLYILHPAVQYDLYKYSPTFALAMAPFALFPDWLSLIVWNCCNSLLLFVAIRKFSFTSHKIMVFALWFLLQENLTAIQSAQTNTMIAALLILAFNAFENKKTQWASLFIVLTAFIKIFGVVAFVLFLLYPNKIRFILYSILWTLVLLVLPMLVVSPDQLLFLYKSWWNMLQNDHSVSYGLSVMGWLKSWFYIDPPKIAVVAAGALILLLPLIKTSSYQLPVFRKLLLASVLLWVIIFNHKAESSTFIIAMSGVALWWFSVKSNTLFLSLVVFAFVFTSLSPTDIFPRPLRLEWVEPYVLKAVPCIFIWFVIQWQMLSGKLEERTS